LADVERGSVSGQDCVVAVVDMALKFWNHHMSIKHRQVDEQEVRVRSGFASGARGATCGV
jgi:hypothetical protein